MLNLKLSSNKDRLKVGKAFKVNYLYQMSALQKEPLDKLVLGNHDDSFVEAKVGAYKLTEKEKEKVCQKRIPLFRAVYLDLKGYKLSFNPTLEKTCFKEISKDKNSVLVAYGFGSNKIRENLLLKIFY